MGARARKVRPQARRVLSVSRVPLAKLAVDTEGGDEGEWVVLAVSQG